VTASSRLSRLVLRLERALVQMRSLGIITHAIVDDGNAGERGQRLLRHLLLLEQCLCMAQLAQAGGKFATQTAQVAARQQYFGQHLIVMVCVAMSVACAYRLLAWLFSPTVCSVSPWQLSTPARSPGAWPGAAAHSPRQSALQRRRDRAPSIVAKQQAGANLEIRIRVRRSRSSADSACRLATSGSVRAETTAWSSNPWTELLSDA